VITRDNRDGIAILRLAHGKVSALDVHFCTAIVRELDDIAADDARALVIAGSGSTFSAGVDLFQVLEGGADYLSRFLPAMAALFESLLTFSKPVVAAINGHAIAGGCIIASACDYRVMADGTARIGIPELAVGVPFPPLPFEIVRARLSPPAFRDLVFSARTVLPAEALLIGLVDEVVPADALLARAEQHAGRLAAIPPVAFALTKRTFNEPVLTRVRAAEAINAGALAAWSSPAVQQRMRAYVEKTVGKK
jgi:enoyl-CoA hydratase